VRFPDPACNAYLAFAAMLMAGLDGIENRIDPGEPLDKDIYRSFTGIDHWAESQPPAIYPTAVAEFPHTMLSLDDPAVRFCCWYTSRRTLCTVRVAKC